MNGKTLLPLGWITAAIFILGTFVLGNLLHGYNPVSQTVSEIGQEGSPLYVPWQVFSIAVGILLILFSLGLIFFSKKNNLSIVPGVFMMAQALSQFGVGFFPSPHELHNVFGLSMTIGYFSPLVFALAWKNNLGKRFKQASLFAFVLIILGIFLNLSPLLTPTLYPLQYYGIAQRFLLFTFYTYAGYVGISLMGYVVQKLE